MKHAEKKKVNKPLVAVRILLSLICIGGAVWFALPLFKSHIQIGMMFGWALCLCGFLLLNCYGIITAHGRRRKLSALYIAVSLTFILFLGWLTFVGVKINTVKYQEPPANTAVMVLGARVFSEGPSASLKSRLDAAYDYLVKNPEAPCIVTGGQGSDEPTTEAYVEKEYLVNKGIDSGRIVMEEKSTTTEENLRYSLQFFEDNNLEKSIAVVTQGFHQFRSTELAKQMGYQVYSIKAYTDPMMFPDFFGRELVAVTKFYLDGLLR